MKVFIAGPRAVTRLNNAVKERLQNIINNNITVIVGDANGVDKLIQGYCFEMGYKNVIVFASNGKARNNLGNWEIEKVIVGKDKKGFDFYAAKDEAMAKTADYGFMIWNGKSKGTLNNMYNLVSLNKKVLVYFIPDKQFYKLNSKQEIEWLRNKDKKGSFNMPKENVDKVEDNQLSLFEKSEPFASKQKEHKKVPQEIFNKVNENVQALAKLFPSVVKDGEVDFEALKEELGQFQEVGKEKYELTWAGKQNAKRIANEDILGKTLKFVSEDSKDADTTENLYIEGDNLEVLKLLRQNYYNSVKMIYIDPPYNTGKDFVYNDKYFDTTRTTEFKEGDVTDSERYIINQKSSGRYHSNWLNMMYPRLKLSKDLLSENGIIFISINDIELSNLITVCNDIFGEENFLAQLIWNTEGNTDNQLQIKIKHEYILVYVKNHLNKDTAVGYVLDPNTRSDSNLHKGYADNNINKNNPANPPKIITLPQGFPSDVDALTIDKDCVNTKFFEITSTEKIISKNIMSKYNIQGLPVKLDDMQIKDYKLQKSVRIYGGFANSEKLIKFIYNDCKPIIDEGEKLYFYINRNGCVRYRKEREKARNILSVLNNMGTTERMKSELKRMGISFDYPKPNDLIKYLIRIGAAEEGSTVLDFFSGSGTTAHSVMSLNSEDNLLRRYILVQYPENTEENSEAFKSGHKNICEIAKERIRLAGEKIKEEIKGIDGKENLDIGFKVFRVNGTNIRWTNEALKKGQIEINESIMSDKDKLDFMPYATDLDVVYEIMLRQRDIPLSSKVEKLSEIGDRTYIFADSYLVCLEEKITEELVVKLAAIEPLPFKFIFRDSAFEDNISLKDETFRRLQILIERNTGESKKTYTVEFL